MNSIPLQSLSKTCTWIDAKDGSGLDPLTSLKSALGTAHDKTVFGVQSTDKQTEAALRDFCKTTRNTYLGVKHFVDHDMHYVEKRTVECQRCSNTRVVAYGIAAIGTLAYTAPQVLNSNPSGVVTIAFIAALAALPTVAINNFRLLKQVLRKGLWA